MSNFNDLDDQNKRGWNPNGIANEIWSTLGVYKFVGQIVDAYVPKLVDLFVAFSGGDISNRDNKTSMTDPGSDPNNKGPRDPEQWKGK